PERPLQKPAFEHSTRSSVITMPSPSNVARRDAVGPRSAVSVPSNGTRSWVSSQKGFRDELPHRQRSNDDEGASIAGPSSHAIGSPNSVSTIAVRRSGTSPS